jgi:hypothetical protein
MKRIDTSDRLDWRLGIALHESMHCNKRDGELRTLDMFMFCSMQQEQSAATGRMCEMPMQGAEQSK